MTELVVYKHTSTWTRETVPSAITNRHRTQKGTWGKICLLSGELDYYALSEEGDILDRRVYRPFDDIPLIEPQTWHRVALTSEDTRFFIEFLCRPEDYEEKKYGFISPIQKY